MNDNLSDLLEHHECCNQSKINDLQKKIDDLNEIIYTVSAMTDSMLYDTSVTMQSKPENHAVKLIRDYLMGKVQFDNDQK